MKRVSILLLVATLVLSACNYNVSKETARPASGFSESLSSDQVDFSLLQSSVIGPRCYGCHTDATGNQGGVNLERYKTVRAALSRVAYRSLERRDMPPSGLSEPEMKLLRSWIEAGAPEKISGVAQKPDPNLDRGPNDWTKIRDHVFKAKCLACHSGENPDGDLDLSSLPQVRAHAAVIFERVIVTQDMPLAPYPVMTPKERRVLLQWFDSGMPE